VDYGTGATGNPTLFTTQREARREEPSWHQFRHFSWLNCEVANIDGPMDKKNGARVSPRAVPCSQAASFLPVGSFNDDVAMRQRPVAHLRNPAICSLMSFESGSVSVNACLGHTFAASFLDLTLS